MKLFALLLAVFFVRTTTAQTQNVPHVGHSHNDYHQERPFFTAAESGMASIEADVWAVNGELFVAHDKEDIKTENTFRQMYLNPTISWLDQQKTADVKQSGFILLVDLKSSYNPTLDILVKQIEPYRQYFDPKLNPQAVTLVISGNFPPNKAFKNYPDWVFFDGRPTIKYSKKQLKRIGMISDSFKSYSNWNGIDNPEKGELDAVKAFVDACHKKGKKARLWGAPDTPLAWRILLELGMDFINTDSPQELNRFLQDEMGWDNQD